MFCPKCGDELEEVNGRWRCARGNMYLSDDMARRLLDLFVKEIRNSAQRPASFRWGGSWFCPGCGVRLEESQGVVRCNLCGQSLDGLLLHSLIEIHPHANGDGTWR